MGREVAVLFGEDWQETKRERVPSIDRMSQVGERLAQHPQHLRLMGA
jgi:hypothetical protein